MNWHFVIETTEFPVANKAPPFCSDTLFSLNLQSLILTFSVTAEIEIAAPLSLFSLFSKSQSSNKVSAVPLIEIVPLVLNVNWQVWKTNFPESKVIGKIDPSQLQVVKRQFEKVERLVFIFEDWKIGLET